MNAVRIIAIVLILLGIFVLVTGRISYSRKTSTAAVGPLELSVKERKSIDVPQWVGIATILVGGILLVVPKKK